VHGIIESTLLGNELVKSFPLKCVTTIRSPLLSNGANSEAEAVESTRTRMERVLLIYEVGRLAIAL
jgi:hypothetical protein